MAFKSQHAFELKRPQHAFELKRPASSVCTVSNSTDAELRAERPRWHRELVTDLPERDRSASDRRQPLPWSPVSRAEGRVLRQRCSIREDHDSLDDGTTVFFDAFAEGSRPQPPACWLPASTPATPHR